MTWIYGNSFLPFTVASATSQLTGYEKEKLAIYDEHTYLRSWRSNNQTSAQTIRCTFSPTVTIAAIGLLHTNGPVLQLKKSTDNGSSYTDLITGSGSFSDYTATKHLAYYRYFTPVSGATGITDVQVVVKAQTPVDGAAYLELGSIVFLGTVNTLPKPPNLGMRERLVREYDKSGMRKRAAGPWRSEMQWDIILRDMSSSLATWRSVLLQGEDAFFLIAKANAATSEVYVMSYDGAVDIEDQKRYGRLSARWVEMP